jgi:hypothetical protein
MKREMPIRKSNIEGKSLPSKEFYPGVDKTELKFNAPPAATEEILEYLHARKLVDSGLYKLDITDKGILIIRDGKGKEIFSSENLVPLESAYRKWISEEFMRGSEKGN